MSKLLYIAFLGGLLWSSQSKAQVVLEALDAPEFKLPSGITLSSGERFLVSIYDNDYLPFNLPTTPATWDRPINAGGGNDILIDYQGTITTTGIEVTIPISVTGTVQLPEYNQTINIPAEKTEDGISRDIVLQWQSQTLASTNKFLTAMIRAVDGTLNLKKLDLNGGLGSDMKGLLLASFTYPSTETGTITSKYDLRLITGIPDRYFPIPITINGVRRHMHQFLYLPVHLADGSVWLNNNLGAEYAKVDSQYFNPAQQAIEFQDEKAAGSNFLSIGTQVRLGEELININDHWVTIGGRRIYNSYDGPAQAGLPVYSIPDPCPIGFRVPKREEVLSMMFAESRVSPIPNVNQITVDGRLDYDENNNWELSKLKLPMPNYPALLPLSNQNHFPNIITGTIVDDLYIVGEWKGFNHNPRNAWITRLSNTHTVTTLADWIYSRHYNGAIRCIKAQ
ncbi:hypothetical protein [Bergeyella zoohelcum]|uniref:hypothetical protein n=1 Tax=Bergeyella zoohelcum TaxID=1015 RepID=UPI003735A935